MRVSRLCAAGFRGSGRVVGNNRPKSPHPTMESLTKGLYFLSVEFSSGGGVPLPSMSLAVGGRGGTPVRYGLLYPSFRRAGQACDRLGGTLLRDRHSPMPVL